MQAHPQAVLLPAFGDPVGDAQRVFKAVMQALACPARPVALDIGLKTPAPLSPLAAAVLLALADYETPVWLDAALRRPDVERFLAFHTGARIVGDTQDAAFALASTPATMPPLSALRQGTPEYPDRSATLIVQVEGFAAHGLQCEGPGIKQRTGFSFSGMPERLAGELRANRAQFPCGVDVVLAAPAAVAALPRSVRILKEA